MKFWEAVEIARYSPGTVIQRDGEEKAVWKHESLRWLNTGFSHVWLTPLVLDSAWSVVKSEPNQYTFAEAW